MISIISDNSQTEAYFSSAPEFKLELFYESSKRFSCHST
jgi:hypothetical protein